MSRYTNVTLAIEPDLLAAVRARALAEDRSVSSVIRIGIRMLLESSEAAPNGGPAKTRTAMRDATAA